MSLLFCSCASHSIYASRQVKTIRGEHGWDVDNIGLAEGFNIKVGDTIKSWTPPGEGKETQDCSTDSSPITLEIGGVLVRILQGMESPSSTLTCIQGSLMHLLRCAFVLLRWSQGCTCVSPQMLDDGMCLCACRLGRKSYPPVFTRARSS